MCPFLDDDDYTADISQPSESGRGGHMSDFFRNERKVLFVVGGISLAVFCGALYFLYSGSKPINLEELPVISAEKGPFKIKPTTNESVKHQDKTVYDNISGDKRKIEEKIVKQPEEVVSIPEMDGGGSLSAEEKKKIMRAFDDLAPEKEYRINYIKKDAPKIQSNNFIVVEDEYRAPINRIKENKNKKQQQLLPVALPPLPSAPAVQKKPKQRLRDFMGKKSFDGIGEDGGFMVQIAAVTSKAAAETEYRRILFRNKFLKGTGKKIYKVDLGQQKGIRYRIQIGPFQTREEADKIIAAMKRNGFTAYISK
ncbi:MAG: SPOR domain-containing protein [Holosporaceae bacterium]|jgi:cell division protein FtsN|nr:SPOR domain-containing protein [Holosporaceae bacterium]